MTKIGDIDQINLYQTYLYCDETFCRNMMQIVKEVQSTGLIYRLQMFDDITDECNNIATYADCYHRIIPILYGLRLFPEEIRENNFIK
jgi:hypothetical protein